MLLKCVVSCVCFSLLTHGSRVSKKDEKSKIMKTNEKRFRVPSMELGGKELSSRHAGETSLSFSPYSYNFRLYAKHFVLYLEKYFLIQGSAFNAYLNMYNKSETYGRISNLQGSHYRR